MLNPNIIGAIQSIPIAQVIDLPATLEEKQEVITEENPIQIVDVSGLVLELQDKATITQVQDLQTEINTKLDEANSNHFPNYSFYCVDNINDLHSVLPNITNQGSTISVSSGSFGNTTPLTIDKNNLAIFGVSATPAIVEFNAPLTIPNTALRIRMNYLSWDNVCILNGRNCVFSNTTFNNDCFIGEGMNTYQTYNACEFSSGKTITFSNQLAGPVYFINCNIAGANLVYNNLSPLLVIFSNCSGFLSLPTTAQATLVGLNVKADGSIVQQNISKIVLPTGEGTNNQVLTSTGSGNCIWTTVSGGGSGSGGLCLEMISKVCQGQTHITVRGDTITFPNINAVIVPGQEGEFSEIGRIPDGYRPPVGTKLLIFEYRFHCGYSGNFGATYCRFNCRTGFYGNVPPAPTITHTESFVRSTAGMGDTSWYSIKCVLNIDPSLDDNIINGTLQNYNTAKIIYFSAARTLTNAFPQIHSKNPEIPALVQPTLTIQAFS